MSLQRGSAYSLIEVLIAGAIVAIGIAAAALMVNAILVQEEANGYALRAFNTQEQAARLWQLGVSSTDITNILPERCSANSTNPGACSIYLDFSSATTTNAGAGTVQILQQTNVFHSGSDATNTPIYSTHEITVVRPTIR